MLSPKFQFRLEVVFDSDYHLLASDELFEELDDAVQKPYLAKKIRQTVYMELVAHLRTVADLVAVYSIVEVCRDPKDNFLLALAKDGSADYLITGDKDLLIIKEFENTKIVTLPDFEAAASNF